MKNLEFIVWKTLSRVTTLGIVSVISLGATPSFAQKYSATVLNPLPDGSAAYAAAINNANEVVGSSANNSSGEMSAVSWNGSTATALPDLAFTFGQGSEALAINDSGTIIGVGFNGGLFGVSGFVSNGTANNFYNGSGQVAAINDSGEIVGSSLALNGQNEGPYSEPTVWSNASGLSVLPTLPGFNCGGGAAGINGTGTVVGVSISCATNSPIRATRWSIEGTATDLGTLGGADSWAVAINNTGFTVGYANLHNGLLHAAVWGPATRAFDLGTLGGKSSRADAINNEGDVVGSAQTSYGVWHAVLWTHKHYQAIDLNSEIDPKLAHEFTLSDAVATNDKCRMVVTGYSNTTQLRASWVLSLTDQSNCNEQ